jgi:DNA-binding SARP family transcriptional activator
MTALEPTTISFTIEGELPPPVVICLLGDFRLLKSSQPIAVRSGGKAEALLGLLGLRACQRVARDAILAALWPAGDPTLAGQSLNSLVYSLNRQLADAIGGAAAVQHADGYYRLNAEAGVMVDVADFESLVARGDRCARGGDLAGAVAQYRRAAGLYRGDLWSGSELAAVIERERLRARYLTLLAWLADYSYERGDYLTCLDVTRQLLASDPCREDAHRIAMRCYVRQGQRAQALRQYRLCANILRAEFDTAPEPATTALYDQIRLDPGSV